MTKNHNMGRKSHHVQDAQWQQNLAGLSDELGSQPTRPSIHQQKPTKNSKEIPRPTK